MYWFVITKKGRSAFPSANHCQGQLHTTQTVTVLFASQSLLRHGCVGVQKWAQPLSKESHQMSKAFSFRRYIGIRPSHSNYPSVLWASQQFILQIISLCCWQTCLRFAYTTTNGGVMRDKLSRTALEGSGGGLTEAISRDIP
jgi:hypothetical protein